MTKDWEASSAKTLNFLGIGMVTRGEAQLMAIRSMIAWMSCWPMVEEDTKALRIQQTMDWLLHQAATWSWDRSTVFLITLR